MRIVEGQIVTCVLNIRTAFFCGIDECKENRVLERYGFIAVYMDDMFVQCLEWDMIAHKTIRNRYSYCSDYL